MASLKSDTVIIESPRLVERKRKYQVAFDREFSALESWEKITEQEEGDLILMLLRAYRRQDASCETGVSSPLSDTKRKVI